MSPDQISAEIKQRKKDAPGKGALRDVKKTLTHSERDGCLVWMKKLRADDAARPGRGVHRPITSMFCRG